MRGIDLLTAFEDRAYRFPDPERLDRATALDRALVSMDLDLVIEAERRQREGVDFAGVIFAKQGLAIGLLIEDLELVARAAGPGELRNVLLRLPLP